MTRTNLCLLLVLIVTTGESSVLDVQLVRDATLPDLSDICESGSFTGASEKCAEQLKIVCANMTLLVTILDATAKFPYSGLGYATKWEYGNYDQCLTIDHSYNGGRILGEHCAVGILLPDIFGNLSDSESYYRLGMCRPDGCSASDLNAMVENITGIYAPAFQDMMCSTKETDKEITALDIVTAVIMGVCTFLMVICTIYDFYLYKKHLKCQRPVYLAFSVLSNGRKLFHVQKHNKEQIETFNGLKVISMMWIIAGHGFVGFPSVSVSNIADIENWQLKRSSGYITTAPLAVDTFFFISGFLLAYQYLKQKTRPLGAQVRTVPYLYLHRYLRLTPSLLVFYLMCISLFRLIGRGPMWNYYTSILINACKEYWWSFFLYIQNYYNYDDVCMTHTWYLSADMQMFLLSPLVLIPITLQLRKSSGFKISMIELLVLNIFFVALPMTIKLVFPDYGNSYDTHSRLINYFIGFMLAVFMRVKREKPFLYMVDRENVAFANLFLWILMLLGMLTTVICYQEVELFHGYESISVFYSLMRPAWCTGLSWIVYSCYHGYGGFINWMLTRPIFQILGKLTYCMYLLHGPVLVYYICTVRTTFYFSDFQAFYLFCGHYAVTAIASLYWTLAFESPVIIIEKHIFGGATKKPEDKAQHNGNTIEETKKGVSSVA